MFEGKILPEGVEPAVAEGDFGKEGLRALSWGELVARFGAARDFRSLTERQLDAGEGSFDASSARHLAGHGDGEPGINPIALTNRKMATCIEFEVNSNALTDDRGRQ